MVFGVQGRAVLAARDSAYTVSIYTPCFKLEVNLKFKLNAEFKYPDYVPFTQP